MVLSGESFGEYAALDRAGVLEFPDVLVLVSVRVVLILLHHAKRHGHAAVVPPRRVCAAHVAAHHACAAHVAAHHTRSVAATRLVASRLLKSRLFSAKS